MPLARQLRPEGGTYRAGICGAQAALQRRPQLTDHSTMASAVTLPPVAQPIAQTSGRLGERSPVSHREIVDGVRPIREANSAWVRP
jgi:hypothetical protein